MAKMGFGPKLRLSKPVAMAEKMKMLVELSKQRLTTLHTDYQLVWQRHRGIFTVRSAYSLLQSMKPNKDIPDSSVIWRLLWQLQLPPKVLNFLWRSSTNSLPTRFNLSTKHVPIAATCPFCLAAPETILHVLVQCSFAQSCWSKAPISVVAPDALMFSSWFEAGLVSWNSVEALEAGMVCWSVWTHRNELVWNSKHPDASEVVTMAKLNYVEWFNAQKVASFYSVANIEDPKEDFLCPTTSSSLSTPEEAPSSPAHSQVNSHNSTGFDMSPATVSSSSVSAANIEDPKEDFLYRCNDLLIIRCTKDSLFCYELITAVMSHLGSSLYTQVFGLLYK
ncbi:hypothetical protein G4B88_030613 [Cannabis sativa]|uniref:Reverse transcriptase zinc-binding domain-containing protein n=1 Tax=Cannabis sativa TaxID=3483 RepID=A0A7J6H745_CANSA|nr:hypothetical protein G4B88_030613 [Cannabis sativa]